MICPKTIFVTGANGYLGTDFVRVAKAKGSEIIALGRAVHSGGLGKEPGKGPGNATGQLLWSLGDPFPHVEDTPEPVLVHFAYDWSDLRCSADNINVSGSRLLFDSFQSRFPQGKILFVSSVSARSSGGNVYGQIKYRIEGFAGIPMAIIRVGLVYSWPPKGQVRMLASLSRLPFTLLPGANNHVQPIPLAAVSDCIMQLSENSQVAGEETLVNQTVLVAGASVAFRDFVRMLALAYGNSSLTIIAAPVAPASFTLNVLAIIGLPVSFLLERVRGLAATKRQEGLVPEGMEWESQYSAFEKNKNVHRSALLQEARVLLGTTSSKMVDTPNLRAYVRHQERHNHPVINISAFWKLTPTRLLWLRLFPKVSGNSGNTKLIMAIYESWWLRCRKSDGGN